IAADLVRAPSLPVALPSYRLTLLDVKADRRGIELVLGPTDPVASLRLEPRKGAALQALTAGRPSPAIVSVVETHAAARRYTLETNAIQFAKPGAVEKLRDAGMTECFVSLHSGDAEVSDAITRAPGTFARTVKGVRALLDAGVPVGLNCVLTNEGIDHVAGLP